MIQIHRRYKRLFSLLLALAITVCCSTIQAEAASSKYVSSANAKVWLNILGAVETGGQVYGERDYTSFIGPFVGSPYEYSCTAGAYQEYGENLRQLLLAFQKKYPKTFKKLDTANIAKDLKRTWSDSKPYSVKAGSKKAKVIQKIISCKFGRALQDQRALNLLDSYLADIKKLGVTNLRCGLFMAECYHLGGYAAVKRVVNRATDKNSLAALRHSLYQDRKDKTSAYQIGDVVYKTRHEKIYKWLKKYVPETTTF